ncbi:MAG: hypothetical protein M1482_01180 [Chloroflexi bacterium]|nr:hypothetical protein [Chloroflexota bacterium]
MSTIISYVPDLMFATRIQDAARALGYDLRAIDSPAGFDAAAGGGRPPLVVISLDTPDWRAAVESAKSVGARVLAFGSHRDVDTMLSARAAGCDEVVARSRMAAELPELLKKYAG